MCSAGEVETDLAEHPLPLKQALFWLVVGLILLVVSSRALVWGAVFIAQILGVSRPDHRPDHRGHQHLAAGAGIQHRGGAQGRARYCLW